MRSFPYVPFRWRRPFIWRRAAVCVAGLLLSACGGRQQIDPQSALDTADTQYRSGLQALESGDLWTAQAQFERARGLDPGFPGSYVGDALVAGAQGEYFHARQSIEQALHRDGSFVDAHVALGRIVVDEGLAKGRDSDAWLEEASRAFGRAARLAPDRTEPDYYLAQAQARAGELDLALASYARVIARNRGPLVAPAMAASERLQTIQRSAPGTRVGARIAMEEQLDRAELAVLLLEEMHLEDLVRQRRAPAAPAPFRPPPVATGTAPTIAPQTTTGARLASSWAQPWLQRAFQLGLTGLEPLPDGSTGGDQVVTRADLARVIESILILLQSSPDLATRYVGEPSRFADVRADHFSYNAVALSVDRGIMQPDPVTGRFRPDDPVSGAEALRIVRELQNAVRMEF